MNNGTYSSTSSSSYVNHNKNDPNHDAHDAYTLNKAKAHMSSTWASTDDQTQYASSYKSTYSSNAPSPQMQPAASPTLAPANPPAASHRAAEYNILNGTLSSTHARQPGTFFAGRVSAAKLEARNNARDPNFDIISHETHADHREYAGYHES